MYSISIMLLIAIITTSISASPTLWPNIPALDTSIKNSCVQFQLLQGSNRIAEFNAIASILFKQKSENNTYSLSTNIYTQNDIKKMLGNADAIMPNGNWQYNLNPSQPNNTVTFNFNE